jgi:sulfite exporter TauE/SafE
MSAVALLASAALMGLAGTPHCAGMCAAGCAAVAKLCKPQQAERALTGVLIGRLIGYGLAGAAVASAAGALRWLGDSVAWMRPIWSALQLMVLMLGLWLLVRGRLPTGVQAWAEQLVRRPPREGWTRVRMPGELKAVGIGALWPAIPCGLLHAALLVAAVASGPVEGAGVMLAFAATSSVGLILGPAFWLRLMPAAVRARAGINEGGTLALRLAGALVVVTMGWSLGHSLFEPLQAAWCA